MNSITKFFYRVIVRIGSRSLLIPDKLYLSCRYYLVFGKKINWKNPKTFNEKLNWLKIYDRHPEYTAMVDKYEVKRYVAERIGDKYIIPTYAVWNRIEDVDFSSLPNQFVIKCTHNSSIGLYVCKDKRLMNESEVLRGLHEGLSKNFYLSGREWPYKNVKPRIIAEKYMEDSTTKDLRDYKFFCFNGVPKALFIATERQNPNEETKFDFFDMEYNHLDITNGHEQANTIPSKPLNFELMKKLASELSLGIPHLRVDFYEVDGRVYVGELTFSHWGALMPFEPEKWDEIFGSWITLPSVAR